MRYPSDPTRAWNGAAALLLLIAIPTISILARWGLGPVAPNPAVATAPDVAVVDPGDTPERGGPAIAMVHFDDRLWRRASESSDVEVDATAPTETVPTAVPYILLGITTQASEFTADLYDATADAIVGAEAGSVLGSWRVSAIGATFVELTGRGGRTVRFDLDLGAPVVSTRRAGR